MQMLILFNRQALTERSQAKEKAEDREAGEKPEQQYHLPKGKRALSSGVWADPIYLTNLLVPSEIPGKLTISLYEKMRFSKFKRKHYTPCRNHATINEKRRTGGSCSTSVGHIVPNGTDIWAR